MLGPLVGAAIGFGIANSQTRMYESTSKVLVEQSSALSAPGQVDIEYSQHLTETYRELVLVNPVMQRASESISGIMSASEIKQALKISGSSSARILKITAHYSNPDMAASIANTVAVAFIEQTEEQQIADLARRRLLAEAHGLLDADAILAAQVSTRGSLRIIDPAVPNRDAVVPRPIQSGTVGAILGLLIGLGIAFVIELVRDPLGGIEELERTYEVTGIGTIWRYEESEISKLSQGILDTPKGQLAETFRMLFANVRFATGTRQARTILITSPRESEGKSTIVSNLAVTAAMSGLRVTVVEADMRRPSLSERFEVEKGGHGLSSYIASSNVTVSEATSIPLQDNLPDLKIVFAGPVPPNPAELLSSPRLVDLLTDVRADADLVLIDSPPVMPVADPLILVNHADVAILVVDERITKGSHVREALRAIRRVGAHVAGIIVNNTDRRWSGYGYGYYEYGKSPYGAESDSDEENRSLGKKILGVFRIGKSS